MAKLNEMLKASVHWVVDNLAPPLLRRAFYAPQRRWPVRSIPSRGRHRLRPIPFAIGIAISLFIWDSGHLAWMAGSAYWRYRLLRPAVASARAGDFQPLQDQFKALVHQLSQFSRAADRLLIPRLIGFSYDQQAVVGLLDLSAMGVARGYDALAYLQPVVPLLLGANGIEFSGLDQEQRYALVNAIIDLPNELERWQMPFDQMLWRMGMLPDGPYRAQRLGQVVSALKQAKPALAQGWQAARTLSLSLPSLLGFLEPRRTLILLQNSNELRPTGGFWGTYVVADVKSGKLKGLKLDNVYTLDYASRNQSKVAAPEPLRLYNRTPRWYLRDANWSPDFPASARQAIEFYQRESGENNPIQTVVAFDQSLPVSLLRAVGPVTVDGVTFQADTLGEQLQEVVGRDYQERGKDLFNRKDVIGALAVQVVQRLGYIRPADALRLVQQVSQLADQKHLLLYSTDPPEQQAWQQLGWDGAVPSAAEDTLLIVDSNLGSLKSDPYVQRSIDYQVEPQADGRLLATLRYRYDHQGHFAWDVTRYRTWLRVYVPEGSELVQAEGALLKDRSTKPGAVERTGELGRTVFGMFVSVEPKRQHEVVLKYLLPAKITVENYQLRLQKQAGTPGWAVELRLPKVVRQKSGEGIERTKGNAVSGRVLTDWEVE